MLAAVPALRARGAVRRDCEWRNDDHRVPDPHRGQPAERHHGRPRRQPVVHRARGNKIGRITTAGVITEFPVPTPAAALMGSRQGPTALCGSPSKTGNKIGRITTAGVDHRVPDPDRRQRPQRDHGGPRRQPVVHRVRRQQDRTHHPRRSDHRVRHPDGVRPALGHHGGPDGNVWFTESIGNKIGRITPAGVITEFTIPTRPPTPSGSRRVPTATSGSPSPPATRSGASPPPE